MSKQHTISVNLDCNYTKQILLNVLSKYNASLTLLSNSNTQNKNNETNNNNDNNNIKYETNCILTNTNESGQKDNNKNPMVSIQWDEYENIDWERVYSGELRANYFCIRKGLIRKAQLAHFLNKYKAKNPASILHKAIPETYLFEIDHPDYVDEACCDIPEVLEQLRKQENIQERKLYIAKPSITNKASDVYVFDSEQRLRQIFEEELSEEAINRIREWVIQEYIQNPLCLGNIKKKESPCQGRKFHIRTYVVAVGCLRVYVLDDMLALFAMHPYDPNNLKDSLSHLTNTCVATQHIQESEDEENGDHVSTETISEEEEEEENVIQLFWNLHQDMAVSIKSDQTKSEQTFDDFRRLEFKDLIHIFTQIKEITAEPFKAVVNEINAFQPIPNCFELYGLDFMVDEDMQVHLLEVNAGPDFQKTGDRCQSVVVHLMEETVRVALSGEEKPETHDNSSLPQGKLHCVLETEGVLSRLLL